MLDAERLGDAVGGDVVMGRADAAGGEHVSVARAQRVERRDDLRLLVGDDADFLEIDADIGEVFGDIADVLVLGAARQDLVADDEDRGGDDAGVAVCGTGIGLGVGHWDQNSVLPPPLARRRWRLKARRRNGHNAQFVSNNRAGGMAQAVPPPEQFGAKIA